MIKYDCNYFYGRGIETDGYGNRIISIKYCPVCGNLTEPQIHRKPLIIKELRKWDGKPVWVECFEFLEMSAYYIARMDKQLNRINVWGYDNSRFDEINYGEVWIAYEQKIDSK